ncbi:MAG: hypothetical protein AAF747_05585 [Planctomycetota bacterium]
MRVMVDESCVAEQAESLGEALQAAAAHAEQAGRVVIEVHADGQPLDAAHLDNPDGFDQSCGELSLTTADPASFVRVSLLEAVDALTAAVADQTTAADALESGDVAAAMDRLGASLEIWESVNAVVDRSSRVLRITPADLVPANESGSIDAALGELTAALNRVRDTRAVEDWAGLADVLRYDLKECADQWTALLRGAADKLGEAGA